MPEKSVLAFCSIKDVGQTGALSTHAFQGIFKQGPIRLLAEVHEVHSRLHAIDPALAPSSAILHMDSKPILAIEHIPGMTLEEVLTTEPDPDVVLRIVEKTIKVLQRSTCSKAKQTEGGRAFVEELLEALRASAKRADLYLPHLYRVRAAGNKIVCSDAHRDLSVGNVIVSQGETIRFIDPSTTVPHTRKASPTASPVIDAVALQISIERKMSERKQAGLHVPQLHPLFDAFLADLKQKKLANKSVELLARTVIFSMYVACRCKYCLDPIRRPLYDEMIQQLRTHLSSLASL